MRKRFFSAVLCLVMLTSMLAAITVTAEEVIDRVSLWNNLSYYSEAVPSGTKLVVDAFDASNNSVDLSGKTITYKSERPWVVDIDDEGNLIDNGYLGSTKITATVDGVTGGFFLIKTDGDGPESYNRTLFVHDEDETYGGNDHPFTTADGTPVTSATGNYIYKRVFNADQTSAAKTDGERDFNGDAVANNGHYGNITVGGGNGDWSINLDYRSLSWDVQGKIRLKQFWFYDDGTSAINVDLATTQKKALMDEYGHGVIAAWQPNSSVGYYWYGNLSAAEGSESYTTTAPTKSLNTIERTVGWHQATQIIDEDGTIHLYIDDKEMLTAGFAASDNAAANFRINANSAGKFDDFVICANPNTTRPADYVGELLPLAGLDLSGNKTYYSEAVPEGTKLTVKGIDAEGEERSLADVALTYSSTRPWVFDVDADGTIIDGGYDGTTTITATAGDFSASLIFIKGTDNGYNSTEMMGTRSTFTGKSGYMWRTYTGADYANVTQKTTGGHDGGDYFVKNTAGTNGDSGVSIRYARGSWDNEGQARVLQGWFYDDGLRAVNIVLQMAQNDPENLTASNTNGADAFESWKSYGLDPELKAAAKADGTGFYWTGGLKADAGADVYSTVDFGEAQAIQSKRTVGWHQLTSILDEDGKVRVYLDGQEIKVSAIKAGNHDSQFYMTGLSAGNYDDFVLTQNLNTTKPEDYVVRPMAPVASGVKILGLPEIGRTISADALITDMNEEDELSATYVWEVFEDGEWGPLGVTTKDYTIKETDLGKKFRVIVTPVSSAEPKTGKAVTSAATAAVTEQIAPTAKDAAIDGVFEIGQTVKASYEYEAAASGVGPGKPIYVFETASNEAGPYNEVQRSESEYFEIKNNHFGKYLRVRVIPKDSNGVSGNEDVSEAHKIGGSVQYFVALNGDAGNPGTIEAPFASIEQARDEIRKLTVKPEGGIVVNIRGGVYEIKDTISFAAQDSGTESCPIVYQAYNNEDVSFVGGKELDTSKIEPVTNEDLLKRLSDQSVRSHLYQLDLGAQGIEMSPVDGNGWYDFPVDAPNEIFMNGTRLTRARWPNDDESQMLIKASPTTGADLSKYNKGSSPIMMTYPDKEDRTNNWEFKKNDMLVGGAIAFGWAASELRIDELNTKDKWFTTSDNHVYGIDPSIVGWGPQYKIYFANIFEEIDKPGESYVDRENGILYFYPVGKVEGSEMMVSTLEKEMISVSGASHLTFKGIDFKDSRATLVKLYASNNISILDGAIAGSASQMGIQIHTCTDIKVAGNHIYSIGGDAIQITNCGDRLNVATKPANVVIENNNIHNFSYNYGGSGGKMGIFINGSAGITIKNNEISDFPVEAIMAQGSNDIMIEYNKIHHGSTFATDNGAIYWGRDATSYGITVRHNHFEEIGSTHVNRYLHMGTAGSLFVDDSGTGPEMYGNIFVDGGIGCDLNAWLDGGYGTLSWSTNAGAFFNCHDNIIIRKSDDRSQVWGSLTTWHTGEFFSYEDGGKTVDVDPRTAVNVWAKMMGTYNFIYPRATDTALSETNQKLLFSDEWKAHYKGTNWERATNFYTKENYETGLAYKEANDSNGFLKWVNETFSKEHKNLINNNVIIGDVDQRHGPFDPKYYGEIPTTEEKNNYFTDLASGAELFEDFDGNNYNITDEGLAKIKTVATDFDAPDFDKIGLYPNGKGEIPGGVAPSAKIKDELVNGIAAPGNTITPAYDFIDADGDAEGNSRVYWYVADRENGTYSMVRDQAKHNFVVTDDFGGRYLKYEVIPYDQYGLRGNKVMSAPITVRKAGSLNTAEISAAIQEATEVLANATIGTGAGQYPAEAKAALEEAVAAAKAVANNVDATQNQINKAAEELKTAIALFKSKQNNITDSYDVTYDRITLNKLIADEENWTGVTNINAPVPERVTFEDGKLVLNGLVFSSYSAKKFKNTEFTFKYKVEPIDETSDNVAWGAVFLRQGLPDKCLWNGNSGEMIDLKTNLTMLQEFPTVGAYDQFTDFCIEYGKEYLMTAGLYDLNNENKLLFVITVDGKTIYAKVLESNQLYGLDGYIGFCAGENTKVTVSPVDVDTSALDKTIAAAESLKETVKPGTGYSQCAPELLEALDKAIAAAKAAKENDEIVAYDVEKINAALQEAINAVKKGTNSEGALDKDGDINVNYDLDESEIEIADDVKDVTFKVDANEETPVIKVESSDMAMNIPQGTVISEDFKLPLKSEGAPSGNFTLGEVSNTYAQGSATATANKPVRIVLKGEKGKQVAYKNGSSYVNVTKTLREDSIAAAAAALTGNTKAVKMTDGDDLVIYTYLLTEFVTYEKTVADDDDDDDDYIGNVSGNSKPALGGAGSGGGGGFFSTTTTTPSADATNTFVFSDMTSHWAKADVMSMYNAGIVSGVTANTFEPDRSITRAEFATLIAKGLKLTLETTNDFSDVASTDWFAPYVGAAAKAGIIVGADGKFRPNDTITREEMAVIIVKAYTYLGGKGANGAIDNFSDKAQISSWAKAYVDSAASAGLISGMGDGTFGPKANATRAQAASLVYRVIK